LRQFIPSLRKFASTLEFMYNGERERERELKIVGENRCARESERVEKKRRVKLNEIQRGRCQGDRVNNKEWEGERQERERESNI